MSEQEKADATEKIPRRKWKKRRYRNIRVREEYLDREFCLKRAQKMIDYNEWKTITREQLAKEIYGHAYVYYQWAYLKKLPIANSLIYKHVEDGIDLEDKADKFHFLWEWIWNRKEK